MPVATTTCTICGEQVTKRASLALAPLDPTQKGRACRTHKVVQELCVKKQSEESLKRTWARAEFNLGVIAAVSWVRVQCTFAGMPKSLALYRLEERMPKDIVAAAKLELETRGCLMSSDEQQEAMAAAVMLAMRSK